MLVIFEVPVVSHFMIFGLFSMPMLGIALKRGLGGVTGGMLALTLTVIVLLWVYPAQSHRVSELQAMVLAASFFSLITGSVVTANAHATKGLQHREAVLESVAHAATQILNKSDWEKRVPEVLRHLAQATEVSRVYLVENRLQNGKLSFEHVIYEWSDEVISADSHHARVLNLLRSHRMEESARLLSDGHAYHYHTQDLAEKERTIFTTLGIRSTLVVPIFVDQHWWGCLGLDRDLTQPDWSLPEVTALRAAARILGTLLARGTTEHQFRQLTGNIRAVFWISSPDGYRRIYVSPAYEQIWGRSCASLHSEPSSWLSAIHASDSERVQAALTKQMWGEYDVEYRIILPDRSVRWIRDRGFPAKDEQGQVCHVVGLAEDITKQRLVEEQLRATTLLLSTLVDNLQSGILVEDESRRVIHVSQMFCEMFELPTPRESILDVDSRLIFRKPKEFADRIEQLIKSGERQMGEELALEDGRILKRDYIPIRTCADDHYHLWQYQDITDRKKAEQQIKSSLTEKEVLLKEIHHRVKNNLQIISSLLSLQGRQMDKGNSSQLFRDSQNRLKAMALIHERLYQSPDLTQIDFAGYVRGLSDYLLKTYQVNPNVRLHVNVERVPMTVDTAIPCSLIINELVSNSLKYAFPDGREGTVQVKLGSTDEGTLRLIVADDGVGIPAGFDVTSSSSLGLKLVRSLTAQLCGSMLYDDNAPGMTVEINFPRTK